MQTAWLLYNSEYPDFLAPNTDSGTHGQDPDDPSWVAGDMTLTAVTSSDFEESTSPTYLVGAQYADFGSLGPYTKNANIYRCPADRSQVTFNGAIADRTRSIAMNGWVGFNARDWSGCPPYRLNYKMNSLINPGPSLTWVFIDERENSINDGWFAVDMVSQGGSATWVDVPAMRHHNGAVLSFADGHTEFKKWLDGRTLAPLNPNTPSSDNPDIAWLQARTTGLQ